MSAPARCDPDPGWEVPPLQEPLPKAPRLSRAEAAALGFDTIDEADYERLLALGVQPRDMPQVVDLV